MSIFRSLFEGKNRGRGREVEMPPKANGEAVPVNGLSIPEAISAPQEQIRCDVAEMTALPTRPWIEISEKGVAFLPAELAKSGEVGDAAFFQFVDQFFLAGYAFSGLDYDRFAALLWNRDDPLIASDVEKMAPIFFAKGVQSFPVLPYPDDEVLYFPKNVQMGDKGALYTFQSVGKLLSADAFVAFLWRNRVKFGVQFSKISDAISKKWTGKMVVASPRLAERGSDAFATPHSQIRRDESPKKMVGGLVDLAQRQNRFPQAKMGDVLVIKTPLVPGRAGRGVNGEVIAAEISKDLPMEAWCGEGVTVGGSADGKMALVAVQSGFVHAPSGRETAWRVLPHIVVQGNVSRQETGDLLDLQGDVEVTGNVENVKISGFGVAVKEGALSVTIESKGAARPRERGAIAIGTTAGKCNFSIKNGDIFVRDRIINGSMMVARSGSIGGKVGEGVSGGDVPTVELSFLFGKKILVKNPKNSVFIADEVEVLGDAQNCIFIVGKRLKMGGVKDSDYSRSIPQTKVFQVQLQFLPKQEIEESIADTREIFQKMVKLFLESKEVSWQAFGKTLLGFAERERSSAVQVIALKKEGEDLIKSIGNPTQKRLIQTAQMPAIAIARAQRQLALLDEYAQWSCEGAEGIKAVPLLLPKEKVVPEVDVVEWRNLVAEVGQFLSALNAGPVR